MSTWSCPCGALEPGSRRSSERLVGWKAGPHACSSLTGCATFLSPWPCTHCCHGSGDACWRRRGHGEAHVPALVCSSITGVTAFLLPEFQPTRM